MRAARVQRNAHAPGVRAAGKHRDPGFRQKVRKPSGQANLGFVGKNGNRLMRLCDDDRHFRVCNGGNAGRTLVGIDIRQRPGHRQPDPACSDIHDRLPQTALLNIDPGPRGVTPRRLGNIDPGTHRLRADILHLEVDFSFPIRLVSEALEYMIRAHDQVKRFANLRRKICMNRQSMTEQAVRKFDFGVGQRQLGRLAPLVVPDERGAAGVNDALPEQPAHGKRVAVELQPVLAGGIQHVPCNRKSTIGQARRGDNQAVQFQSG